MPQPGQPADTPPLNGWKEIAAYLGRSVRSVQRYEHELGLPIHRLTHADGQTVYAFRHEIDAWRERLDLQRHLPEDVPDSPQAAVEVLQAAPDEGPHPQPPNAAVLVTGASRRLRSAVWVTLGLAIVVTMVWGVGAAFSGSPDRVMPTEFVLIGHLLEARDSTRRVVWSKDFGVDVSPAGASGGWMIADLDDNGTPEVIVGVRFAAIGQLASRSDVLYAFSRDGELKWSKTVPDTLACRTETFSSPWRIHAMAVSDRPGPKTTWVAFNHQTWWPGLVLEIGPDGTDRLRYAQTGWIRTLAAWTISSGSYLAVGGVTNDQEQPTLALVDLAKSPATTPAVAERFSCTGLPPAAPSALFLFPNPETVGARGQPYTFVTQLLVMGPTLKASVDAEGGAEIVQLTADFTIADVSFSDTFWLNHRELEREGKIRHPAERCPERLQQVIRRWMPDTGWQDFKVVPTIRTSLTSAGR